ncbi:MAG: HAMP domain-containing protein [Peptostreptococcaceae bacterium]|nr:HAMP domain-containing protein [Peptostreptococcaceae bacterium]
MKNSLKYKFIMIYFFLVFVVVIIIGVFITKEFENYNMSNIRNEIINIKENIIDNMISSDYTNDTNKLRSDLLAMPISLSYEISIIEPKSYTVIASTNSVFESKNAFDVFDSDTLLSSYNSSVVERDIYPTNASYPIKNMVLQGKDSQGNTKYLVYARRNLDDIQQMDKKVVSIIIKSAIVALLITILLGNVVSASITVPIQNLTKLALMVSKGDFSKKAHVSSDDEIGKLAGTFNFLTDSVEDMIKKLSYEKNKLDAIIFHMNQALVAIDNYGKIIHFNANFLQLLGLDNSDDLHGKNYDDLISTITDELSFSQLIRSYSKDSSQNIKLQIKDRFYQSSSAVFKEKNGALAGIILVFRDISESEYLENMRRDFVANVSHELKTPITSIKSYSETLLDGAYEDKEITKEFLGIINSESDRMSLIIKDLLQLSRMDSDKEKWEHKVTDINELVRQSIKILNLQAKEKEQKIISDLYDKPINLDVDAGKIRQVIINLLSNAIKYTGIGGVIHLSTSLVDNLCKIVVKDDGIGIPEKDIEHIFDRFYRVDKGRSRALGGTGLGLSITQSIIEAHSGKIYVNSVLGQGSEFIVTLPVDNLWINS